MVVIVTVNAILVVTLGKDWWGDPHSKPECFLTAVQQLIPYDKYFINEENGQLALQITEKTEQTLDQKENAQTIKELDDLIQNTANDSQK